MRQIGSAEDLDRMKFIRLQIEKAVLPFRENTEAAIVIGACLQVARTLLVLYPEQTQAELLEAMVPFLKGTQIEGAEEPSIILPRFQS